MRLSFQLFITLLIASALLVALMFGISSWSFSRGFLGYINNAEKLRLEPLVAELAQKYEADPDWDWVSGDSRLWRELLDTHIRDRRPVRDRRAPPPHDAGRIGRSLEPRPRNTSDAANARRLDKRESRPKTESRGGPGIDPRLLFKDADGKLLRGRVTADKNVQWLPIAVNEVVVGSLGYSPQSRLTEQFDQAFDRQQKRSFAFAALAMIILSGLLSMPLAARIVKPILKLNKAVHAISNGDYHHRVEIQRKDEIGALASNVNVLGNTLEKNLAARQRWIAEISHELRTPVAVLQGEIEALQDGVRPFDRQSADSLHTEVLRLSRLINDLHQLSLSDIGALDYRMSSVSLGDFIKDYVDANQASVQAGQLTATVHPGVQPVMILGDRQRLEQLLNNLLQNSLRYTDPGGVIEISLSVTDSLATLNWSDSSPTVSDADLPHLLEPLFRAEPSRNRGQGGAGLGLSIARNIVDAHGGTITAERSSLGGLSINIVLPLTGEVTT